MQVSVATRVLAVLVTHDGSRWLPATLDALEAQAHPNLDIVAVDNASSDGSRELLIDRLGTDRVLVADRDLGFGAAVSMALDARSDEAEYVWLLHDDVAFLPDALTQLIGALSQDPRLAAVGPKLRDWSDGERLQSVGWTIDITGRADSGVEPGELDQGQRDEQRRTLYVSTAGMLIRRDVIDELGGFDHRFHVFRDDLDLCWRAWLAGYEVEVVPNALGAHVAAAAEYVRLGQTRYLGPRYFAERNTLAALLKNYGPARLPFVVVLYLLVGVAKVAGFLLTRRLSDAWQTVRAWGWNLLHLRETLRLRRRTQMLRRRTDSELKPLFGRLTWRVRAYAEAIVHWIAGGDVAPAPIDIQPEADEEPRRGNTLVRMIRTRPVSVAGTVLLLAIIGGAWHLWLPGQIRGGQLAAWPSSPLAFLGDYVAGWHAAGAFGTSTDPSPAQALLGILHFAVGGSEYLAPRVLLFGSIAAAWVFALRAAQTLSARRIPRVVAATAYVLSPPSLAALMTGQVSALILLAVIPGLVAVGVVLADRTVSASRAWRAVSGAVLLGAVGVAFEPLLMPVLVITGFVVLLVIFGSELPVTWKRLLTARFLVAALGPFVLLLPWSLSLVDPSGPLLAGGGLAAGGKLWRWIALSPSIVEFPGLVAGSGFVLAGFLGLVLGFKRHSALVAVLWAVAFAGGMFGWLLGRAGEFAWPGTPLLVTAAAFAALYALAFESAEAQLAKFGFGWRQVSAVVTAAAVSVSLAAGVVGLARSPLDAYALDDPALPAFIDAAAQAGADFRVLVLADSGDDIAWDVITGHGPLMSSTGLATSAAYEVVDSIVDDVLSRRDPMAASRLGLLSVRYVVVPSGGTSPALDAALRGQFELEPRPVGSGRVYSVVGWLPRSAVVSTTDPWDPWRLQASDDVEVAALDVVGAGVFAGVTDVAGPVLLAEADDGQWRATVSGRPLTQTETPTGMVAFEPVEANTRIEIVHQGGAARSFAVNGQVLALLLVISLALRPPRFARRDDDALPAAEPQLPAARGGV
ncbi:MAG: glycosyltransferase family 2 protein [Nitriliruptoraceae bacterium]